MDDVLAAKLTDLLAVQLPQYAERMARVEATQAISVANVEKLTAVTTQISEFMIRHDQEERTQNQERARMHQENQERMAQSQKKIDKLSLKWAIIAVVATMLIAMSQFFAPEIRKILGLKPTQTVEIQTPSTAANTPPYLSTSKWQP